MSDGVGRLVLVATPIGNLGDLSARAVETLRSADVIACEDTRHSQKLLNAAEIRGPKLIAVHEHNESESAARIVEWIRNGSTIAMITDAGMPGISDPGERVVALVAAEGLTVSVVPGPSAVPAALAVSGLPAQRFCFEGFLPRKGSDRTARLTELTDEHRTVVIYEAANRLLATAQELATACGGDRRIALVRELTKLHEEVWRGTLDELIGRLEDSAVKGECVLILEGAAEREVTDEAIVNCLAEHLQGGLSRKDAVLATAHELGVGRNRVYGMATESGHPR